MRSQHQGVVTGLSSIVPRRDLKAAGREERQDETILGKVDIGESSFVQMKPSFARTPSSTLRPTSSGAIPESARAGAAMSWPGPKRSCRARSAPQICVETGPGQSTETPIPSDASSSRNSSE